MDPTLEETLKNAFLGTSLGPTSQNQYAKKIAQWVSYTEKKSLEYLMDHSEEALDALKEAPIKQTATNIHLYISAMVGYVMHINKKEDKIKEWKGLQQINWEPLSEHYAKNEPTEKQKDKVIEWSKIEEIRESLEEGSFERLLLSFYTLMEPIRADYYATEIIVEGEESKEDNYIKLTNQKANLIVTDFKTKNKYEKIENTLCEKLQRELKISLEKYPRKYLFVMEDKMKPYTRKLFSNWACRTLTRILKQQMTLTVLRHLYISEKIKEETPLEELKEIAKKMGHSRDMQRVYDWSK
jgi:hypothetical protein